MKKKQTKKYPFATDESGRLDRKSKRRSTQDSGVEMWQCISHSATQLNSAGALATVPFLLDSRRQGNSWRMESFLKERGSQSYSLPAPMLFMMLPVPLAGGPAWETMGSEVSTISSEPLKHWHCLVRCFFSLSPEFSRWISACDLQTQQLLLKKKNGPWDQVGQVSIYCQEGCGKEQKCCSLPLLLAL